MLAGQGRDEVEYVVVHELTHLAAHDHGPLFRALMDERLPDWRERRERLHGGGARGRGALGGGGEDRRNERQGLKAGAGTGKREA